MYKNKRIYYINSRNGLLETDTTNDFHVILDIPPLHNYTHIVLLQAEIPKSFYLIQAGRNDSFILDEDGVEYLITIPEGNYKLKGFIKQLETLLNSTGVYTYTMTYPTFTQVQTAKFTFTVSNNGGIQPKFKFNNSAETAYELMGFDIGSTNTFSGDTLKSSNIINFGGEDILMIHSNTINNQGDDLLQEIYAGTTPWYGSIVYQCTDVEAYAKRLVYSKNNLYRFSLRNDDGDLINLNGINMMLTIMLFEKEDNKERQKLTEIRNLLMNEINPPKDDKKDDKKDN